MRAATIPLPAVPSPEWLDQLRRELAPFPGRAAMTIRLVVTVVLVTIISMTLQVPEVALSAYMVFFVTKENRVLTALTGALLILGATVAIAASLFLYRYTLDFPALRVLTMSAVVFAGMYLSRVIVIGPLGFAIGFVAAMAQSIVDGAHTAEIAVRSLLWVWVIVVYPIVLTVVINQVLLPVHPPPAPLQGPPRRKKHLFVDDALTNPAHVRFALKVTLAAMTCYLLYTAVDWPGIRTSFITCCFLALESTGATMRKARLRLLGCLIGGLLGFLSILCVIPHLETIVSLAMLTAAISALAGWVAAGSERVAYAGLQIAFAFYLSIFQGFAPATGFDVIRDRIAGIMLGIFVLSLVYRYLWPDSVEASSEATD